MSASLWAHRPPPAKDTGCSDVGRWRPTTLAELSTSRRELSAALRDGADEQAVEQLLLAFEELASNALRHGRAPVEVAVTRLGPCWLLEVSDAAADRSPTPARDRDPALGGLGLPLVAALCADHGWAVVGNRKVVWGRMDHSRSAPDPAPPPRPRGARAGDRRAH